MATVVVALTVRATLGVALIVEFCVWLTVADGDEPVLFEATTVVLPLPEYELLRDVSTEADEDMLIDGDAVGERDVLIVELIDELPEPDFDDVEQPDGDFEPRTEGVDVPVRLDVVCDDLDDVLDMNAECDRDGLADSDTDIRGDAEPETQPLLEGVDDSVAVAFAVDDCVWGVIAGVELPVTIMLLLAVEKALPVREPTTVVDGVLLSDEGGDADGDFDESDGDADADAVVDGERESGAETVDDSDDAGERDADTEPLFDCEERADADTVPLTDREPVALLLLLTVGRVLADGENDASGDADVDALRDGDVDADGDLLKNALRDKVEEAV